MATFEVRWTPTHRGLMNKRKDDLASMIMSLLRDPTEATPALLRGNDDLMQQLRVEIRDSILNTPELRDFMAAVPIEVLHQRKRWGKAHDAGKEPQDWFWLIGYLAGKALRSDLDGDTDKALHHTITIAAACRNWHAAISGTDTSMRPGIEPPLGEAHS